MEEKLVCYCFGYSEKDIITDFFENSATSSVTERIMGEKKKGHADAAQTIHCVGDASEMSAVSWTGQKSR